MPRETIADWQNTAKWWKSQWRKQKCWTVTAAVGVVAWIGSAWMEKQSFEAIQHVVTVKVDQQRPAPTVGLRGDAPTLPFVPVDAPQRMAMRKVGEPPTSGKYAVTKTSPARVLASVRIGKWGGCSGTIIKRHENAAWGITAWHCSNRIGTQFTIGNPDGSEATAWWVARDESLDLALFITKSKEVLAAADVCEAATPDWTKGVEAIGYPGGNGPIWKRFKYNRTEGHGERGNRKYFRDRYLFDVNYGFFGSGDSGGGVFYDGNHLIGVMTHGGPHAASLPQIQRFLKAHVKEFSRFDGASPFS